MVDESRMIAGQSRFLSDRFVFTGGYCEDTRDDRRAVGGGVRQPNSSNLWTKLNDILGEADSFAGNTTTFGLFLSPFNRIGFTYNQANSVLPQSPPNPYNQLYGTRVGKSKVYGLRINLLDDKLYVSVNAFTTDDTNRQTNVFVQQQQGMNQAIPAIVDALRVARRPLPASMVASGANDWLGGNGHTVDTSGKGDDFELGGRLTLNRCISFNFVANDQSDTNIAPFHNAFFAETRAAWEKNTTRLTDTPAIVQSFVRLRDGTPGRDFVQNPATIANASALMAEINRVSGQEQLHHQKESMNVFTSYRFGDSSLPFLRGMRIGGGANYRTSPVNGYDSANNNAPIRGITNLLKNLMVGKTFRLGRNETFDVQPNVQNVLAVHDMIPPAGPRSGAVHRFQLSPGAPQREPEGLLPVLKE
jgi:hypothetical protein